MIPVHKIFKKNDSAERIVILVALHYKEAYKIFSFLVKKKKVRGKVMQYFKEEMNSENIR